jgi:hypothetical protein
LTIQHSLCKSVVTGYPFCFVAAIFAKQINFV